ncbi:hypothetical protein IWW39_000622 [Coemansia spiralis]|uniref:Uncharacterized protein n=1 Tax=Coemansia spiralis TaxID=417178 RepID=A0A9W8GRC9_9FUNG|nr:hypothetical protein IWW39_000622 [Coemansia spiralis]
MSTNKDITAQMEELVDKMHELAEQGPTMSTKTLRTLSLCTQKMLVNAKQHSAESMKDLLLAEEQYEVNQHKRAEELHKLKEARQAEMIAHKKAKEEAEEASNERYDQGVAKLIEVGCKEALAVAAVARTAKACKENVRAITTSQGFDEEFWANNNPGRAMVTATSPKVHTMAEVVSGVPQSTEVTTEELAEKERLAQHTADLRELERCSRLKVVKQTAFFVPEMKRFKELKEIKEEEAVRAFSEPGEHITFKEMVIIALKQNNPTLFNKKFALVHRKLVAVLLADMTLYNMSHINSETMELVVPAMYYAQMCMYLCRLGQIMTMPKPCYLMGHSDRTMEPTLLSTINRWKKEAKDAKSMEGQTWYEEAIAAHEETLQAAAKARQYIPLAEHQRLASQENMDHQTDAEGFEMQNKHAQSARSSNFTDGASDRQQAMKTQNKYMVLDMDTTEDSNEDSNEDSTNDSNPDPSNSKYVGSPSRAPGGQSSF